MTVYHRYFTVDATEPYWRLITVLFIE